MVQVLVLGDSHARVFRWCNRMQKKVKFRVVAVHGASAQGLTNADSKTSALTNFRTMLKSINPADFDYVLVSLGENDCAVLIWFRSNKHHITVEDQLDQSTNNLFAFVKSEVLPYFDPSKVILGGSIMPVTFDTSVLRRTTPRRMVAAPILDRTNLTILYNKKLMDHAEKEGYHYMDITKYIVDPATNLVNPEFKRPNVRDHHLLFPATYTFWLTELANISAPRLAAATEH